MAVEQHFKEEIHVLTFLATESVKRCEEGCQTMNMNSIGFTEGCPTTNSTLLVNNSFMGNIRRVIDARGRLLSTSEAQESREAITEWDSSFPNPECLGNSQVHP